MTIMHPWTPTSPVKLAPGRVAIPDFIVADTDCTGTAAEAAEVALIGEVLEPGGGAELIFKQHCYAAAGIRWYLLLEQEPLTLRLFRLDGDHYVEHTSAVGGEVLDVREPFPFRIDTASLPR
ncbi:Uma2 family endonuclease [Dactylosporangium sp. NPDC049742]|uniref:Uma2 family endonuclease n=1 Tax=Dactylosporangium sp. NPDC049742 TaxID=3154737 RepID=UPI00343EFD58